MLDTWPGRKTCSEDQLGRAIDLADTSECKMLQQLTFQKISRINNTILLVLTMLHDLGRERERAMEQEFWELNVFVLSGRGGSEPEER